MSLVWGQGDAKEKQGHHGSMPLSPRSLPSWSATLKLPVSQFPSRASSAAQVNYLKRCTDDLYAWQASARSSDPSPTATFVLHDGPPYANGSLHIGHALNKILKDITCRFQLSQGKRVHYVPGWDCHGLPIEIKALQLRRGLNSSSAKDVKEEDHKDMAAVAVRGAARELALGAIEQQKRDFREWAVMGDWDSAYKTMEKGYILRQLGVFKDMVAKGLIKRQHKPVYWSPSSATALAEAELEYDEEYQSIAAWVEFPIVKMSDALSALLGSRAKQLRALIWTTTPWTLPGNKAIAVHENITYTIVRHYMDKSRTHLLIAKDRLGYLQEVAGIPDEFLRIVVDSIPGSDIAGQMWYINELQGKKAEPQPFLHADFVSANSGSGLVHMAPGHGMDDYNVCIKHGIPAFAPVDDHGCFTHLALPDKPKLLEGKNVQIEGTTAVLEYLGRNVLARHKYKHKYPIDWRTKQPVIVRATEQWFADLKGIREAALESLKQVNFVPPTGEDRLRSFIMSRGEWCISRQRSWGVPIPALFRQTGDFMEVIMTPQSIEHIMTVVDERGIDAWWTDEEDDPTWVQPDLAGTFVRGRDTMDVWFDSGTSWTSLPNRAGDASADMYLEGTDQHRGWFQSSLLTYIAYNLRKDSALRPEGLNAPYKSLITHGFVLDQDGRKMSKSLGNVISPEQITSGTLLPPMQSQKKVKGEVRSKTETPVYDGMGADALRLWVANSDYTKDIIVGQPVLQAVNTNLQKYRITFKWLLGVLDDFDAIKDGAYLPDLESLQVSPPEKDSHHIDLLALAWLAETSRNAHSSYGRLSFSQAVKHVNAYINRDLSSFLFELLKDRLYAGSQTARRSAQATLFKVFIELQHMLTPICPLLIEEVWDHTPQTLRGSLEPPGRRVWEPPGRLSLDAALLNRMRAVCAVHDAVKLTQEAARAEKRIGSSLECSVILHVPFSTLTHSEPEAASMALGSLSDEALAEIFVVSQAQLLTSDSEVEKRTASAQWIFKSEFTLKGDPDWKGTAYVLPPKGEKCVRCWGYVAPEKGGVCARCDDVLKERGIDGPRGLDSPKEKC